MDTFSIIAIISVIMIVCFRLAVLFFFPSYSIFSYYVFFSEGTMLNNLSLVSAIP